MPYSVSRVKINLTFLFLPPPSAETDAAFTLTPEKPEEAPQGWSPQLYVIHVIVVESLCVHTCSTSCTTVHSMVVVSLCVHIHVVPYLFPLSSLLHKLHMSLHVQLWVCKFPLKHLWPYLADGNSFDSLCFQPLLDKNKVMYTSYSFNS